MAKANVYNYAEKYSSELIEIINQGALTSPFITSNVEFTGAKTFHFTQMGVSGFKTHSRAGGWNRGVINQSDHEFTVEHDRDIEFLVDKADVDETSRTAAVKNVSKIFVQTQQVPEMDAYAFSRIAATALATDGLSSSTALSAYTKDNVYSKIVAMMGKGKLKYYRQRGSLIGYVRSEIMDLLAISTEMKLNVQADTLTENGKGIETRIVKINGVTLIEVVDTDRFGSIFDFTDGYAPTEATKTINIMFVSVEKVKTVPKISSIYYFSAGEHTLGDGDLYQNRSLWDTFIFPNGKEGKIDSIFVDMEA